MQNSELARSYYICVCSNDDCRMRFPALANDARANQCPVCGSPVRHVYQGEYEQEAASAHYPPQPQVRNSHLLLLLDNIRSAFNVGSIFRIADGAGVSHMHLCGFTPTPDNRKVAKTSLGAETSVAWSSRSNALDLAQELSNAGHTLISLEYTPDSSSLFDLTVEMLDDVVLIAGNELTGVDPGLLEASDAVVHLPMTGVKGSLNVAVATGIAVYWLQNRLSTVDSGS